MTEATKAPDRIRQLIWLYFWLLIFEGALRKWVFPQYTSILLVVRDPVVVAIYALAIYQGRFPWNPFVIVTAALGVICFVISLLVLEVGSFRNTFLISGYGLRANYLHLPLIFVIPKVLTAEDTRRIGYALLAVAIPMAALVFAQYQAPMNSWVNVGSFGEESRQIDAAVFGVTKVRPPGVFAFTTGLSFFLAALAAFLLNGAFKTKYYPRWFVVAAAIAFLLMMGFSISRTTIMGVLVVFIAALLVCILRPQLIKGGLSVVIATGALLLLISSWSTYTESLEIVTARFEGTGGFKTGIFDRFIGGFSRPIQIAMETPLFGYGLGLGTNGGISILGLLGVFSLGEAEWTRVIREVGPVLGLIYLSLRLMIALYIGRKAIAAVLRGNPLPLLLFSACALLLIQGQFGQTTTLGFAVFLGGLSLAAMREEEDVSIDGPVELRDRTIVRGRAAYAEALHH